MVLALALQKPRFIVSFQSLLNTIVYMAYDPVPQKKKTPKEKEDETPPIAITSMTICKAESKCLEAFPT